MSSRMEDGIMKASASHWKRERVALVGGNRESVAGERAVALRGHEIDAGLGPTAARGIAAGGHCVANRGDAAIAARHERRTRHTHAM